MKNLSTFLAVILSWSSAAFAQDVPIPPTPSLFDQGYNGLKYELLSETNKLVYISGWVDAEYCIPTYNNPFPENGELVIPSQITDFESVTYTVVAIGDPRMDPSNPFEYDEYDDNYQTPDYTFTIHDLKNTSITSLIIPPSIRYICPNAFEYCQSLESVTFLESSSPQNVSIGTSAFCDCTSLKRMELPEGLTGISDYMLQNCRNLELLTVPSTVTSLGQWALSSVGANTPGGCTINAIPAKLDPSGFYNTCQYAKITHLNLPYRNYISQDHNWPIDGEFEIGLYILKDEFQGHSPSADYTYDDKNNLYRKIEVNGKTMCEFIGFIERPADSPASVNIPDWTYSVDDTGGWQPHRIYRIADDAFLNESISKLSFDFSIRQIGDAFNYSDIKVIHITNNSRSYNETTMPQISSNAFSLSQIGVISVPETLFNAFKNTAPWSSLASKLTTLNDQTNLLNQKTGLCYKVGDDFKSVTINTVISTTATQATLKAAETMDIPAEITHTDGSKLTVAGISNDLFRFCESLKTVNFEESATELSYASGIKIPSTVETLNINRNLKGTTSMMPTETRSAGNLANINIGDKVTDLTYSISETPNGVTISSEASNAPNVSAAFSNDPSNLKLIVPEGAIPTYRKAIHWNEILNISDAAGNVLGLHVILPNGHIEFPQTTLGENKVRIVPEDGYSINNATLGEGENAQELTEDGNGFYVIPPLVDNTRLNVVFKKNGTTGTDLAKEKSHIKVYASQHTIRVVGASQNAAVTLFDTEGKMLTQTREHTFSTSESGILILTVDGETFKFAM